MQFAGKLRSPPFLSLSMLGKKFSRRHFEIYLFSLEKGTICTADDILILPSENKF